ncbi:Vacuolar protein sorting-associated protein 9a [Golovinomyces cichoracearum]|uniref:Vacuolar protein sorting-associated protein 9a n=1 Tax=Golovinomyces cichoracearum TaxID=62708 RepID=A0A420J4R5_9PEZI|nr:Vacuolar protein sorting-associated protein 9a [Golovinomyces cichoracearum]
MGEVVPLSRKLTKFNPSVLDTLPEGKKDPNYVQSQKSSSSGNQKINSLTDGTTLEVESSLKEGEYTTAQQSTNQMIDKPKVNETLDPPRSPIRSCPGLTKLSVQVQPDLGQNLHFTDHKKKYSKDDTDKSSPRSDVDFDEINSSEDDKEANSRSEIHNIMDQFSENGHGPGHEEVMSPRLEVAGPLVGASIHHPPRTSSLEPSRTTSQDPSISKVPNLLLGKQVSDQSIDGSIMPLELESNSKVDQVNSTEKKNKSLETSIPSSLHRPPPPEPESEPDLPFDFHRFLEQLRHKSADPVAKFLRAFLQEFGKKQWMVHEQVKIISDFLAFISVKMSQCEVWSEVSDAEFDNAREGMEKLVMNRLYTQTFSPAIMPPQPISGSKSKRRSAERLTVAGRRGQHQEDVERDDILAQKVSIYGWIREEHLDIPPVVGSGRNFLVLAQKELLKIKTYRAPRDKIICVLNCSKVIFGLLKHSKSDSSADSFMPLLIYVVLQANPEHLVSNVQYILRFRNQEKLVGEAGYYLSSLLGAVHFIENLDRTTLSISDEEFEKSVEAAVSAIAEKHQAQARESSQHTLELVTRQNEMTPGTSHEVENLTGKKLTSTEATSSEPPEEKAPIGSILRSIQRPLSTIGWIFSDDASQNSISRTQGKIPQDSTQSSRVIPKDSENLSSPNVVKNTGLANQKITDDSIERQARNLPSETFNPLQNEYPDSTDILTDMFPDLDKEIIKDIITQKEGRVLLAVDACLALNSQ